MRVGVPSVGVSAGGCWVVKVLDVDRWVKASDDLLIAAA